MGNDNKMTQFMEEEALAFCDLLKEKIQRTGDSKVHLSMHKGISDVIRIYKRDLREEKCGTRMTETYSEIL